MKPTTTLREYKISKEELLQKLNIGTENEVVSDILLIGGVLTIKTKEEVKDDSEPASEETPSSSNDGQPLFN